MAHSGLPGSRFAVPVSDTNEVALRESAVPRNTKATTEWGVRVWSEWCVQRAMCACTLVFVDQVLCLLFAGSRNCALTGYCTLNCAIRGLRVIPE